MENKKLNTRAGIIIAMVALAVVTRLLSQGTGFYNFAPFGAIALFGAAHFNNKWLAVLVPLAATWVSDLYVNNVIYASYYPEFTWMTTTFLWSGGAYILTALLGFVLFTKLTVSRVAFGAIGATAIFFLISNFSCWPGAKSIYTQDFKGLMDCYIAGLEFIKGTAWGNLIYSAVLFGGFALLKSFVPSLQSSKKLVVA